MHKFKGRSLQSIRNQMAYEKLPEWRKFLHAWKMTGYSIRFPFIWYKLWKMTKEHAKKI